MKSSTSVVEEIRAGIGRGWIPEIYKNKVCSSRTRRYLFQIPAKENQPIVQNTLLGMELQIGKIRLSCPDEATARYLAVFARIGCSEIAIPYDITKVSALADELESAWTKTLEALSNETREFVSPMLGRIRRELIRELRNEIAEIGSGPLKPEFPIANAKQR